MISIIDTLKKHKVSFMNKNKVLLLMLSFGMVTCLVGCKKKPAETVIIEEKRVSGPLSDPDIRWSKEDYQ